MHWTTWFDAFGGVTPIDGNLFRSPIPATRAHIAAVKARGVDVVFSLEEDTPGDLIEAAGLEWRPHFWTDDAPPTRAQVQAFLTELEEIGDQRALIHCRAGWGRAGSAITCALVTRGWNAGDALEHFWARVPPSRHVMTRTGQAEFVHGYASALRGRGLE